MASRKKRAAMMAPSAASNQITASFHFSTLGLGILITEFLACSLRTNSYSKKENLKLRTTAHQLIERGANLKGLGTHKKC
jgi:hypothetical protein